VLLEDRDLAAHLNGSRLETAQRACVARTLALPGGDWSGESRVDEMRFGIGLLILDGLLVRRVGLAGRFGAELLGEGDLLRPWQREDQGTSLPRAGRWRVIEQGRVALLDNEFALRVARYPEVTSALFARAIRRSRYMAVTMAIIHQPRIDIRLHMLFWELADRFGRVHPDGVHVPLRLTHSILGELVAARRPTVTKALGELAERSAVIWTGDEWLLPGRPPSELDELGRLPVADAAAGLGGEVLP
jgi:CRP/FNR family transcriptional regulator, cyclic AMP receptor protein